MIETARKALDADPGNVALVIKLSQAQASVWRSKEAAETCTKALETYPDDIDLLTERGHRYVRQFAQAKADLGRVAALGSKVLGLAGGGVLRVALDPISAGGLNPRLADQTR